MLGSGFRLIGKEVVVAFTRLGGMLYGLSFCRVIQGLVGTGSENGNDYIGLGFRGLGFRVGRP